MSRIGKMPIPLPSGVEATIQGQDVVVKGKKGTLTHRVHGTMRLERQDDALVVVPVNPEDRTSRCFYGLTRSLVNNMVVGVSKGFEKGLKLVGVGYRAQVQGRDLNLTLGYSHPVVYAIPEGIDIKVDKQTELTVSGADKQLVGQVAANIRAYRKPEPYHGKGVRYSDEVIMTKVGKAAGKK